MAFRSIALLEKTVDICNIEIWPVKQKMKIELLCKYSISKVFLIPFIETEGLKASMEPAETANKFCCQSKVLTEVALNFLKNQEEVTMSVTKEDFEMRNYIDPSSAANGFNEPKESNVWSELKMKQDEFVSFAVVNETTMTFPLKELRALMTFADSFSFPLTACFNEGGDPIVFNIRDDTGNFEASLVMSTISTDENANGNTRPPPSASAGTNRTSAAIGSVYDTGSSVMRQLRISTQRQNSSSMSIDNRSERPPSPEDERPDSPMGMFEDTVQDESPPAKRARFYFGRCFEQTFNPASVPGFERVLAPDSDEES